MNDKPVNVIEVHHLDKMPELLKPRRIMKYLLIWCASGSLRIVIDENEFELKPNEVITITSGQIHYVKKTGSAKGIVLQFTYDFFCKDDNDIELIFHNSLFCHFAMNEVIPLRKNESIGAELRLIEQELSEKPFQFLMVVHSRLRLILVEINRAKLMMGGDVYKPDALFLKFLESVKAKFQKKLSVKQHAALLRTTPAKLDELSRQHAGKTAQSVIYGLLTSEAKRLFTYEKLSIKQVAFQLGFSDPFYFSNFFKKHAGLSPKLYREKHSV